jgi:hypothetical protein
MSITPKNIPLVGTRGDDLYYTFINFTIDGSAYPDDAVPVLYMELNGTPSTNYSSTGAWGASEVTFKIPSTNNQDVGKYAYDVEITYANGDKFTHVIGTIDITDDVNKN